MQTFNLQAKLVIKSLLALIIILSVLQTVNAQGITYYQYRKVPDAQINEFIKRETTYWSKVAQKAVDKNKLLFWGLFEKVSGGDQNGSNYLFINTYPNADSAMTGSIWNAAPLFPGIPMSKMETYSMGPVITTLYVKDSAWEQSSKAVPDHDFKYVVINYNHTSDPYAFMALEYKDWQPFVKKAMNDGKTNQMAWGNSVVLSPTGASAKANCLSVDLFSSFSAALTPSWSSDLKFPTDLMTQLDKLTTAPRETEIYRVVKVVSKM